MTSLLNNSNNIKVEFRSNIKVYNNVNEVIQMCVLRFQVFAALYSKLSFVSLVLDQ